MPIEYKEGVFIQLEIFYLVQFRQSKKKGEGFWPSPFILSSQNSASGNESVGLLEHKKTHLRPPRQAS
jgi:hypothetical protein